ncbi:MAG: hypothetical protein H7Y03_15065, partial [Chitinophagaceae bacterium]|nr:hypothetical protein [Chitinophagaceae bacterium]
MTINLLPLVLLSACLTFISCGNNAVTSSVPDSPRTDITTPELDTALSNAPVLSTCYQLVTGSREKDTAFIRLTVDGTDVTGTFSTSIYEKDTRKGTYAGTMRDSIVRAVWSFTQEGIKDSLPI